MSAEEQGRRRVAIERVSPEINCGRFPAKRTIGETLTVEADIFADGHDVLSAALLYRSEDTPEWSETPMAPLGNDRWSGRFEISRIGIYRYTISAWIDRFGSWREGLAKKLEASQEVGIELVAGRDLIEQAANRATGEDRKRLRQFASALQQGGAGSAAKALSPELASLMARYADRRWAVTYEKELRVIADREKARFSTWYEVFPRSCAPTPGVHGTLRDCERRLPYVAGMGFDVLYLPPIHPIGVSFRKGKNNALVAEPGAVGSPWAIGSAEGGHKAIHPELGTLEDFRRLVAKAHEFGIEIALDIAFQCTPDHPYVTEHPEWFRKRPDGTIQYAENPPKKYQDIYPIDFETDAWRELWEELKSVFLFWIEQGVRIFRVDNPHTKPFAFWEWVIGEIKRSHPETIFLAEAFTRPKVMYRLAKLGFTQSYTYFAWRNTKAELTEYFTELTQTEVRDYFRPNLWPNTPDILTEALQLGGRPAFISRLILAATLGASYGIYGPAYELCENVAREPGSEEYLDSEKYELKHWDWERPDSLRELIAQVNRIRKENPALHSNANLRFHAVDNKELICFSKTTDDRSNTILTAVNLDPHHTQAGWTELALDDLGIDPQQPFQVHDLLSGARYLWSGSRNFIQLDPHLVPAHIFRVRRRLRSEQDFDYFM
ncbi:MAG TPA: alpha-1,4-glucan--maltose-1-phosphate maltosyltransferase [Candidatus Eisenbacteria bacterium]|nr:alpha-1,4-glucan--maltose-1-phosphate maltosyltransferase [Candidatus Eisenbacteria bacterium]